MYAEAMSRHLSSPKRHVYCYVPCACFVNLFRIRLSVFPTFSGPACSITDLGYSTVYTVSRYYCMYQCTSIRSLSSTSLVRTHGSWLSFNPVTNSRCYDDFGTNVSSLPLFFRGSRYKTTASYPLVGTCRTPLAMRGYYIVGVINSIANFTTPSCPF